MRAFLFTVIVSAICMLPQSVLAQELSADEIKISYEEYQRVKEEIAAEEEAFGGYITTPNVRMHFLDRGPKDGIPLVWSHGTTFHSHELDEVADALTSAGIRLITVDYYGHGLTPIPAHPVSIFHVADDLRELLDQLQIQEAVIGGWSRGGTIAAAFYQSYPDRALGIILEDGGSEKWTRAFSHSIGDAIASKPNEYAPSGYESEFDLVKGELAKPNPILVRDQTHQLLARGLEEASDGLWYNQAELTRWLWEDTREHSEAWLNNSPDVPLFQRSTVHNEPLVAFRNLKVPLLIFDPVSDDDFHRMTAANENLKDLYPDLVTHLIYEDTMHWVHFSHPERFATHIISFMNEIRDGR